MSDRPFTQRDPDGVFTLSQYNARGQVEYTALDLNSNGVIDFARTDRITRNLSDVVNDATVGFNVNRTRVYVWSANNSAISNLISVAETSVDGLHTWQMGYRDASTPVTNRMDAAFGGSGFRYQTNSAPDGSYSQPIPVWPALDAPLRRPGPITGSEGVLACEFRWRLAAKTIRKPGETPVNSQARTPALHFVNLYAADEKQKRNGCDVGLVL